MVQFSRMDRITRWKKSSIVPATYSHFHFWAPTAVYVSLKTTCNRCSSTYSTSTIPQWPSSECHLQRPSLKWLTFRCDSRSNFWMVINRYRRWPKWKRTVNATRKFDWLPAFPSESYIPWPVYYRWAWVTSPRKIEIKIELFFPNSQPFDIIAWTANLLRWTVSACRNRKCASNLHENLWRLLCASRCIAQRISRWSLSYHRWWTFWKDNR